MQETNINQDYKPQVDSDSNVTPKSTMTNPVESLPEPATFPKENYGVQGKGRRSVLVVGIILLLISLLAALASKLLF